MTIVYETIDPQNPGGPKAKVFFRDTVIDYLLTHRPVQIENLAAAKVVLDSPKRIFSQIRPISDGGWCYTGMPANWSLKENVVTPFPPGMIFAVFMNDRMEVYTWRAEPASPDDRFNPVNWRERFGGLIWKCP